MPQMKNIYSSQSELGRALQGCSAGKGQTADSFPELGLLNVCVCVPHPEGGPSYHT